MPPFNFNAQQYDPTYGMGGGLPPGKGYVGMITATSQENTADGTGGFISLVITCLDGPFKDVTQIDRLNVHNKNPKAVEIANKQLSAYCHVTGQYVLNDTDQLCGKPFKFDVRPQKNNPEYTEIAEIYDINGNKPGKAGTGQQQQPQTRQDIPPPNQQQQPPNQPNNPNQWNPQGGGQVQQPNPGGWTPPNSQQPDPSQSPPNQWSPNGPGAAQPPNNPPPQGGWGGQPPAGGGWNNR